MMTPWIEKRREGWLHYGTMNEATPDRSRSSGRNYTVKKVAKILNVDKRTVMKWLEIDDETGDSVIAAEEWFKLPGRGDIRIS